MTKQEKIMRDTALELCLFCQKHDQAEPYCTVEAPCAAALVTARTIMENMSREGIVVKVERELPKNPYPTDYKDLPKEFQEEATGEDVYLMAGNGFEKGIRYMLKAGFVVTEPLIKEDKV